MRKTFIKTLIELAEKDKSIYLLTGDIGFNALEPFAEKFPERFINCGIAEQNMMGVAAGLALSGKKVYVYSIIPFVTIRCLEQIKNDICFQNLDVKIVGYATGFSYGAQGTTHHAIEDIGVLRVLPNMTVLSPADLTEERELILQSYETKNPTYIRLDKGSGQNLFIPNPSSIILGKPSIIKDGKDGAIIATGSYLETGINIINRLNQMGYNFKLMSMHTLKPIDSESLIRELEGQKLVFTLEEHNIIGGLGSAMAEILLSRGHNTKFKAFAVNDIYPDVAGDQDYLKKYCKIDEDSIFQQIIETGNLKNERPALSQEQAVS
ncbi:MAG: transketolase C-terminal domain-containing protein [Candidatus Staskawiczbacteria bacterium]|nr:transketolase C-terminal domain-containing protein [Candidatus Staskawiczbacteria bacterium]